ncbi:MAG: hypothetical protein Q8R76_13010 [Candidatus Omnitrophota bacterium]|nr:hypothetical protein [Candidatus Omnitrophota bacterium]
MSGKLSEERKNIPFVGSGGRALILDAVQLESERLIFRKLSKEFAAQIFEGIDDEIVRYTSFQKPNAISDTQKFIQEFIKKMAWELI